MAWLHLVALLALVQYAFFLARVGPARFKYKVPAPKISGNEDWERLYRVQMNTLELLVIYLPSLYLFAFTVSPTWGAGIGLLFIIGRGLYSYGYVRAANKRGPGTMLSMLSCVLLLLGAMVGTVLQILG